MTMMIEGPRETTEEPGVWKLPQGFDARAFRTAANESLAELGLERLGSVMTSEDFVRGLRNASNEISTRTVSRYFSSNRGIVEYNAMITQSWSNDERRRERINLLSKIFADGLRLGRERESLARDILKGMFVMHVSEHQYEVPVSIMVQSAAQAYLVKHGASIDDNDPNLEAARLITQQRRDLFTQASEWLSDGLTVLLRYLGRRPGAGLTVSQAATAAHAAYDGFLFRHLADPASLPLDDAVEAMYRMFIALTERGAASPVDMESDRGRLVLAAAQVARKEDFSFAHIAGEAQVEFDAAQRLFNGIEDLAIECMRYLLSLGPDGVMWGHGQLGAAEAISAVTTQLDAIDTMCAGVPPGLVSAAGDRAEEVWEETLSTVSDELSAIPALSDLAPGVAQALVTAARAGDYSWNPMFNAIVMQPSLVGGTALDNLEGQK